MIDDKSSRIPNWTFKRDLGESHDDYGMVHNVVLMALQCQRKGEKRARSFLHEWKSRLFYTYTTFITFYDFQIGIQIE